MATFTVTCPIDGLACFSIDMNWKRNTQRDQESHVHIPLEAKAECANGHAWEISDVLTLTRIAPLPSPWEMLAEGGGS